MNRLVIHCSDSPPGRGDDASTIHAWHRSRGFDGIGYHWVVLEDGTIQPGRPEYWAGAHVRSYNEGSIGVCLIGRDDFTNAQLLALRDLHRDISARYPGIQVFNHYELDSGKTCPNFDAAGFLIEGAINAA